MPNKILRGNEMKKQDELLVLVVSMLKKLGGTFEITPEMATFELDQEIVILTDPETRVTTVALRDKQEEVEKGE
jgi:hypothetical protein